jgi:hypothetical protein
VANEGGAASDCGRDAGAGSLGIESGTSARCECQPSVPLAEALSRGTAGHDNQLPAGDLIHSSRHANIKELRIQHSGRPYRVLFAFDPRRCAILLIGGDKTGNDRWYEEFVPVADGLYDQHLEALKKEQEKK